MYADRYQMWAKWDIFTPDPRSQQVIMRQSYQLEWLARPFAVWRIIGPVQTGKMEKSLDTLPNWFKNRKEEYLAGLETGEIELPSQKPYWEITGDEDAEKEGVF